MLILLEVSNSLYYIDCFYEKLKIYINVLTFVEPISCISSTQDNMCTLVSCTDSTLKLMDKQKGELLNEYKILITILLGYKKIIT